MPSGPRPHVTSGAHAEDPLTSSASEIDALLEWLEEQSSNSTTSSASSSRADTFPGSFVKRGGGNLDASA